MSAPETITIAVPATTANLGPGFDCIGAAIALYNRFRFTLTDGLPESVRITVTGADSDRVGTSAENLAYRAFARLYQRLGQTPPAIALDINVGYPLTRGLGSSATAIVGGLMGANCLAGTPLSPQELLAEAIALEGHPDNVVPALLGGCRLSVADGDRWEIGEIPWHQAIVPVVAIPDFELSTERARAVLPAQVSHREAIFNVARLGLLVRGLATANGEWLRVGMEDRLHQPYRQSLILGYETVVAAGLDAGAWGVAISGAGPSLLALADANCARTVAGEMGRAWSSLDVVAEARAIALDLQGAREGEFAVGNSPGRSPL